MADLFQHTIEIQVPPRTETRGRVHCALIEKRGMVEGRYEVSLSAFSSRGVQGLEGDLPGVGPTLFLRKPTAAQLPGYAILVAPDFTNDGDLSTKSLGGEITWLRPAIMRPAQLGIPDANAICQRVRNTWIDAFSFNREVRNDEGDIVRPGLRAPQIGAIHATLAHWSITDRPATIVMPTGTGKTETMLALLAAVQPERLMVVVPNAALRDQIAEKFLTFGVLKVAGVLSTSAETPMVAILDGRPRTPEEVDEIFQRANVIVTTMQVAGQCEAAVQERMAEHCSHLFIDEAHHIAARTWQNFKAKFAKRTVLQFTATPFRTDGKRVDGKFIYVYPLRKAQSEGYFKPIQFRAVQGLDEAEADNEIIRLVGGQLKTDLANGHDHLVMARARDIKRATALHAKYLNALPEYAPVLIHSGMNVGERADALARMRNRQSRIIVCVDMLGEGFDLPQLKISGLHDRHRSVAITLQFTGRFTRDAKEIGDATVFANIEQSDVDDALRSLYAEDADWNFLLQILSDAKTGRQLKRAKILEGFMDSLEGIPLQTLIPKMSTVVYRSDCEEWRPQEIEQGFPVAMVHTGPIINDEERLAIFVTREDVPVRWSTMKEVADVEWNLYLVHWDSETKLLYVNSSKSKDLHERLAKAVCGESISRFVGEPVYRVLEGFKRLMLSNLGLSSLLGRHVRYTMFVGSDITAQISDGQLAAKRKSNLFGIGFSGDGKRTIGCSAKGKFWSMQSAADFSEWLEWSHEIGKKVTDESIATDSFIRCLVKQEQVSDRPPDKPALAVHWPEGFLIEFEERIELRFGDGDWVGFYECEIELVDHNADGPIRFRVMTENQSATFEIQLSETGAKYPQIDGPEVTIRKAGERPLTEAFGDDPPHVYFADGDFLIFNELFKIPRDDERRVYNENKIESIDWGDTDFSKESQGPEKRPDSIQRFMVERLLADGGPYDVVFDDDGSGEIADIVAIREQDDCLFVDLFHLKFAHGSAPGNRVADLYEVCGQAQKSVRWMEYPVRILKRIRRREKDRIDAGLPSRFEKGGLHNVRDWINRWKTMERRYHVWIVQPGLSKAQVEPKQLDLLAATENYLLDTYGAGLNVIGSI